MTFPACPSTFDSQTPTGRVVHRVCLDKAKPTYQLVVTGRACRLCQSQKTDLARSIQAVNTKATSSPTAPAQAAPPPETPGLVRRTLSYAEALIAWTVAGRPERSDKDVERIFHRHCKRCDWFDSERQICRGCGCRVAENGYAVLNKIKMATENCPRDFW